MFWIGKTPMTVYYQHLLRHITSKLTLRRDSSLPDIDPPLMEWLEDIDRHSRHRLHELHSPHLCSRMRTHSHDFHLHHMPIFGRLGHHHTRTSHSNLSTLHPMSI
uniref:Ovule protein n=1 Tax=Mesocestoides corti TaxID=53468 RepID=A0A5K3FFF6_MESCO